MLLFQHLWWHVAADNFCLILSNFIMCQFFPFMLFVFIQNLKIQKTSCKLLKRAKIGKKKCVWHSSVFRYFIFLILSSSFAAFSVCPAFICCPILFGKILTHVFFQVDSNMNHHTDQLWVGVTKGRRRRVRKRKPNTERKWSKNPRINNGH